MYEEHIENNSIIAKFNNFHRNKHTNDFSAFFESINISKNKEYKDIININHLYGF